MNQPSVVHDPLDADGLHESWARLSAATPVHYLEQYGHWIVASAEHVEQVPRDPVTFSSAAARQVAGSRHSTDYPAALVQVLFKRLPDLHLAKNFPRPAYRPHYNIRFVDSLHVGGDPGSALR